MSAAPALASVGREPPHDLAAEKAALGSVLIRPDAIDELGDLKTDDFFLPVHREIFESMLALRAGSAPLDVVSIAEELKRRGLLSRLEGGESYLLTLANAVPTAENVMHYARIVREKATLRRVIATCAGVSSSAYGDVSAGEVVADLQRQAGGIELHGARRRGAATLLRMADVEPRDVSWLWPGRIPAGMLAVLDGAPGAGKSSVVIDLAARITTGRPWPAAAGRREPRDVILLGHEDSAQHTIRPRLDAAGADPVRVHLLDEIGGHLPRLPDDATEIERAIAGTRAALLVIDPISAYVGPADMHRDSEVRSALAPLVGVADRTGAAIIMIRHLRKAGGVDAMSRGLGSVAISALARTNLMLLRDPDEEDARVLAWACLRVAAQPTSIRWRFDAATPGKPPRIIWDDTACGLTADEILERADGRSRPASAGAAAERFLREALAAGPVLAADLHQRAKDAGIPQITVKRARDRLGVRAFKRGRAWWAGLGRSSDDRTEKDEPDEPLETLARGQEGHPYQEGHNSLLEGMSPLPQEDAV